MNDNKASTNLVIEDEGGSCSDSSCCPPPSPIKRMTPKVGRNDPCPCDSGRKFKKCCGPTYN